jgi:hypothetical protein
MRVDDTATAMFEHQRDLIPHAQEDTSQVDRDHAIAKSVSLRPTGRWCFKGAEPLEARQF